MESSVRHLIHWDHLKISKRQIAHWLEKRKKYTLISQVLEHLRQNNFFSFKFRTNLWSILSILLNICQWFQKNLQQRMPAICQKLYSQHCRQNNYGVWPQNFLDLNGVPRGKYWCKALKFYFVLLLRALDQIRLKSFQDAGKLHISPKSSTYWLQDAVVSQVGALWVTFMFRVNK